MDRAIMEEFVTLEEARKGYQLNNEPHEGVGFRVCTNH